MELDKDDFVLYNENNRIKSGGYSVNSILLNKNNPAFTTYNKQILNYRASYHHLYINVI